MAYPPPYSQQDILAESKAYPPPPPCSQQEILAESMAYPPPPPCSQQDILAESMPAYPPPPPFSQQDILAVIGPQYCVPYNMDLAVTQKFLSLSRGDYTVTDVNGKVTFKVDGRILSLRDRRLLVDNDGNPIVTMKKKLMSAHRRWEVFRGDSSEKSDLLFSVKKSSLLQLKTKLDVLLAANKEEETCNFKIEGSWFERSCCIYLGNTSNIVAQMRKKHKIGNMILNKDMFSVTVYPNVDYAFIVSLIVVLDGISEDRII